MDGGRIGKVMAHVAVVTNLGGCLGCRTCSVRCERARRNRSGAERPWRDEVEARLGRGRPGRHEGRERRRHAVAERPEPREAGRGRRPATLFAPPRTAPGRDCCEPWARGCAHCSPRPGSGPAAAGSPTCVGRLRCLGVVLYDLDRVGEATAAEDARDLYRAQLDVFLDPRDPRVRAAARRDGIPERWLASAGRSPVYLLAKEFNVALPLHPEYRTLPMAWCLPPLSPMMDALTASGRDGEDARHLFDAIAALRAPVEYLAGLCTVGDPAPVTAALRRLAAMRAHMRRLNFGEAPDESIAGAVGLTGADLERMYRLLALARHDERYAVPTAYGVDEADRGVIDEIGRSLDHAVGPAPFGGAPG
ncbi:MAG TPA: hypothetical protein VFU12_00680 [Glycomyces sp.]|nr:hypothetical protein [Glycomyces sp.]